MLLDSHRQSYTVLVNHRQSEIIIGNNRQSLSTSDSISQLYTIIDE